VPLAVVATHLRSVLARTPRSQAFLGGGVTFAGLAPSRPIPARLVCLIGMNDGAYPRESRPPAFDLVGRHRRKGDRVARDEERYAFLDALLAAREALYVSYTGRSVRDAKPLPPSPLVAELLDGVRRAYAPEVRKRAMRSLVTDHPLQPFSVRYSPEDPVRFTYAEEYARRAPVPEPPRFAGRVLPSPEPASAVVTLAELARFLANPARAFLERRLGLRLEGADAPIEAAEPFALDALAGYAADQLAFQLRRAGQTPNEVRCVLRAAGLLPDGRPGELALGRRLDDLEPIVQALQTAEFVDPVEAELDLGPLRLAVRLDQLTRNGRIAWRAGRLRAQDRLEAWVAQLALAALAPAGIARRTRLVTRTEDVEFGIPRAPQATLRVLLGLRARGEREALPFFPESALAYARGMRTGEERAWRDAEKAWEKERQDAYFSLAFGDVDALDERFAALALEVFGPMLDAEAGDA
jgi:exodeoxyribonuclease V gamma subunit